MSSSSRTSPNKPLSTSSSRVARARGERVVAITGAGSAATSSLPLTVSGSSSTTISAAGTM